MEDNSHLWRQLDNLGQMIADGDWEDMAQIKRNYRRIAKILMPEAFADERKAKNEARNRAITKKLEVDKCSKCNSEMKQTRSGSYVVRCTKCGTKFKYKAVRGQK